MMSSETVTTEVVDGVLVAEWHEMQPSDGGGKQVIEMLGRPDVDGYVAVDRTDTYISASAEDDIERLASHVVENNVDRVGLVGEGIKALAAKGSFDEPGVEVRTAEERAEAVEWASEA